MLRRLADEPGVTPVAVNEVWLEPPELARLLRKEAAREAHPVAVDVEDGALRYGTARAVRLSEHDPARLDWEALKIDVVIEAARFFDRAELDAQSAGGRVTVLMTGDLRRGEPDLTLVLGVNDALYRPGASILCAGSDWTQSLTPVLRLAHETFGLERAHVCHLRPPYPAHEWALDGRRDDGEHLARVLPELSGRYHGFRVAAPAVNAATAWLDLVVSASPTQQDWKEQLRFASQGRFRGALRLCTGRANPTGDRASALVNAPVLRAEGHRLWIELTYDPLASYVERVVEILRFLATRR